MVLNTSFQKEIVKIEGNELTKQENCKKNQKLVKTKKHVVTAVKIKKKTLYEFILYS